MVYKITKRPSDLYLSLSTAAANDSNIVNNKENLAKSPLGSKHIAQSTKMVPPTRANSIERKCKLIKKKSSKDKEQLIKGNVFELKKDANNNISNSNTTCECPLNGTNTSGKNKNNNGKINNKVWKNSKLFDAVLDNDTSAVRTCLITDELDVNEYSPEGISALHIASAAGYLECVELLVECGANVDVSDVNNRTPLEYAVIYGNFECASLLIENGADSKVIKNGIN